MANQSEFTYRAKSLCENVNTFLYKLANEPSLAGHRVQEHVYKTVPILTKEKNKICKTVRNIDGTIYDLNYSHDIFKNLNEPIQRSASIRDAISELEYKVRLTGSARATQ